jgi:flagellar hook-associated protein 1
MGGKIHGMLDVGKRSLANSQTALQTVGHNIANKSTEGYSRQRVEIQSNVPIGSEAKVRIGMGAKASNITRVNNPFLEKQIGREQSNLGFINGKMDALTRVEQVYNEQMNKGLNHFMTDFFNSFRELATNPESHAPRQMVKETADFLTKDFKRVNTQLKEIQKEVDFQIATQINEVNEFSREIAELNEKISMVEVSGANANDERDRRDLLIKKLGEKVNIRHAEGKDGMVTITAGETALLVAGTEAKKLSVDSTAETETKGDGNYDVFYHNSKTATPMKITGQLKGGSIGGLLEVRDQTIGELLNDNDTLAYSLATAVNDAHRLGVDGTNKFGYNFFEQPMQVRHAATNLKVSGEILENPARIASAAAQSSPGDNRVANYISNLQFEKIMPSGSTIDDFYNGVVGKVGVVTQRADLAQKSQSDILKNLVNVRESISGVSLDEETTKMIEFQKSFDASARLIRTADEMFDTVLNLKRM